MDEVRRLGALQGSEINEAKKVLAFEVTKLVHGEEEAQKADDAAAALFAGGASAANVPSFTLAKDEFAADSRVTTMLVKSGLCKSQSDARNQVKAGAVLVADKKVDDLNATLAESDVPADGLLIQKGKKNFRRLFLA